LTCEDAGGVESGGTRGPAEALQDAARGDDPSEPGPQQPQGATDAGELRAAAAGAGAGRRKRGAVQGTIAAAGSTRRDQSSTRRGDEGQPTSTYSSAGLLCLPAIR